LAERVDPVLVPQETQELCVETALEDLHVELVVLVRVDAKILDLRQRNGLVLGSGGRGRGIVLGVGPEGTDVYFAGRDSAVRVDLENGVESTFCSLQVGRMDADHDCNERVLELLVV
jgi:shikimate 5-dehydrogenase